MATKNTNLSSFNMEDVPNAKGFSFGIVVSEWNSNITNDLYKGAFDALVECGVNKEDITKYNIGYCDGGMYSNRIIIPSYDLDNRLNYFIARFNRGGR